MRKNILKIKQIAIISLSIICIGRITLAHQGKTDSRGGHNDPQNKSGLGSYHYHCGGHPAHLHTNGVCPYSTSSSSNENTRSNSVETNTKQTTIESNNVKTDESIKESNNTKTNEDIKETNKEENSRVSNITKSLQNEVKENGAEDEEKQENSGIAGGLLALGLLGGGYWGYKKGKVK